MAERLEQTSLAVLQAIVQDGQAGETGITLGTKAGCERSLGAGRRWGPPWFGLEDAARALERRGAIELSVPMAPLVLPNDPVPDASEYLLTTSERMLQSVLDQYKYFGADFASTRTRERGTSVPHHRASLNLVLVNGETAFIEGGGKTRIAAVGDLLVKVLGRRDAAELGDSSWP